MKLLFLDVNQTSTATKITKLNTFQQVGIARAYQDLGHEVFIGSFNKINYSPLKSYNMCTSDDLNEFDVIFITNYVLNFFGGEEIPSMTKSFKLLHNYKGKVIYLLSDFEMKLKQYKPRDEWVGPHDDNDYKIENYKCAIHTFNKKLSEELLGEKVYSFPIQYSAFYKNDMKGPAPFFKVADLTYCGSFRSGRREKKMIHYFFDTNYEVELFGNIKQEQFTDSYKNPPVFLSKVGLEEVSTVNQDGLATIVIGDNSYNNHFFTMRILEAIRDDLILFIDEDYDSQHLLDLPKFNYVRDKKELADKLNLLKNNHDMYTDILDAQQTWFKERFSDEIFLQNCKELLENED